MSCYRSFLFLLVSVVLQLHSLHAQNLFDSLHTARYADFLFQSENYREAIEEFERLVFSGHAGDEQKLQLVKAYRLAGQPRTAFGRISSLWDRPERVSSRLSFEFLALRIINNDMENFEQATLSNPLLNVNDKCFMLASAHLFRDDFGAALSIIDTTSVAQDVSLQAFRYLAGEGLSLHYKSPAIAGVMSALIPGSGRIYAGNWEDGLLSFIVVGVTAWQAYRGFEKRGSSSLYAWIYGLAGIGFYAGNIYGSIREVNRYNHNKRNGIRIRVEAVFYNRL